MPDISSSTILELQSYTPSFKRKVYIGGSDYTSFVRKWPRYSRDFQNLKPTTVTAEFANEEGTFNFFRESAALINNAIVFKLEVDYLTGDFFCRHFQDVTSGELNCAAYDGDSTLVAAGTFSTSSMGNIVVSTDAGSSWNSVYTSAASDNSNFTAVEYGDGWWMLANGKQVLISSDFTNWSAATVNSAGTIYDIKYSSGIWMLGCSQRRMLTSTDRVNFTINTINLAASDDVYAVERFGDYWLAGGSVVFGSNYALLAVSTDNTNFNTLTTPDSKAIYSLAVSSTQIMAACDDAAIYVSSDALTWVANTSIPETNAFYASLGAAYNFGTGMYCVVGADVDSHSTIYISSDAGTWKHIPVQAEAPTGQNFDFHEAVAVNSLFLVVGEDDVEGDAFIGLFDTKEETTLLTTKINDIAYKKGNCVIKSKDKLKQLSERLAGTSDVPVEYIGSDYLPSDLAWWLCTSYGGLDTTGGVGNVDIHYPSFLEWAEVFSDSGVYLEATFKGTKVTEALRKIARMTDSAIYLRNDKIRFRRFSNVSSENYYAVNSNVRNGSLAINQSQVINRQFVFADYSGTSNYFQITVSEQNSSSVNSFGLREEVEKDQNVWHTSSATAQDLAQRIVSLRGEPYEEVSVDTQLNGFGVDIGDMMTYQDDIVEALDTYRVTAMSIDLDKCDISIRGLSNQQVNGFTLDVSSLGGSDTLL